MFSPHSHYTRSSAGPEVRSSIHIPMVYKSLPPLRWEYHVLSIDPREDELPGAEKLSELGRDGWVLASLLDERINNTGNRIHYYFVRQSEEQ